MLKGLPCTFSALRSLSETKTCAEALKARERATDLGQRESTLPSVDLRVILGVEEQPWGKSL